MHWRMILEAHVCGCKPRRSLTGVMGFEAPSWQAVAKGARPEIQPPEEFEPGCFRQGWQHEAASRTEEHFIEVFFDTISNRDRGSHPFSGWKLAQVLLCEWRPQARLTSIQPYLFCVVLLRRLRLPLSLSVRSCRCGCAIDIFGHHRAACARAGVLGRRVFCTRKRSCKDLQGRWRWVRHQHFHAGHGPWCRSRTTNVWKLWVDGLPSCLEGPSSQLTRPLVCAMHCDGSPHLGAAERDGVVLETGWWDPRSKARLVVLAVEVGSRWSAETRSFLTHLAKARCRQEVPLLQQGHSKDVLQPRAVTESLLELSGSTDADG